MTKKSCNNRYEQMINTLLNHITQNLAQELDLQSLSHVAALSPFHLHRIFQAMTGESPGSCVRRLRLQYAAYMLHFQPTKAITCIAHECGFSSSQNFARSFQVWCGKSPSHYRQLCRQGKNLPPIEDSKQGNAQPYEMIYEMSHGVMYSFIRPNMETLQKGATMNVEIQQLPDMQVAYVRHLGPYGASLSQSWNRIMGWAHQANMMDETTQALGISWDNPEITPAEHCRYDAGIIIPSHIKLDKATLAQQGICLQTLPGGSYACYRQKNLKMNEFTQAFTELYGIWLPQSGYECYGAPLELYHAPLSSSNGDSCDVSMCVAVKAKGK